MNGTSTTDPWPIVGVSLAAVSFIACLLALGSLVLFKMYRNFFYRLLLYTFGTLSFLSLIWTLQSIMQLCEEHTEERTQNNCSTGNVVSKFINYAVYSSLCTAYLLLTSLNFCLCRLSIQHKRFSSWRASLIFLIMCFLLPQPFTITLTIICGGITPSWKLLQGSSITMITFVLLIAAAAIVLLTNIILTTLALLPVCCSACGYNQCTRFVATREGHQRALKEILPSLLLFFSYTCLAIISLVLPGKWESIASHLTGLILASSFAIHLCLLGKEKLEKLRGKKRSLAIYKSYGSIGKAVDQYNHRQTAFTSEGISETCNTDFPHVSEDEVDRELNLS